jgi:hypothetical protein
MPGFFGLTLKKYSEDFLHPGNDLVGRRVGRFVKIDDSVLEVLGQRTVQRGRRHGDRGVVRSSHIQLIVILKIRKGVGFGVLLGAGASWRCRNGDPHCWVLSFVLFVSCLSPYLYAIKYL